MSAEGGGGGRGVAPCRFMILYMATVQQNYKQSIYVHLCDTHNMIYHCQNTSESVDATEFTCNVV